MRQRTLGILIGGSSHVGKSTLANRLALELNRELVSTDCLGRHPGRPWPNLRPQVAEYYSSLCDDTIHWFLKVHHENMWPRIRQVIECFQLQATPFIVEGAALRPEYMAQLDPNLARMVFLYAESDFLRARMRREAGYDNVERSMLPIIDKFIERSLRENEEMHEAARAATIPCFDVATPETVDTLVEKLIGEALPVSSR